MLISKFDLYKTGWLDLVFDDRNKSYGAYELRQHYPRTMVRAMVITFLIIGGAALIAGLLIKPVATAVVPLIHITPFRVIQPVQPPAITHPHVTHVQAHSSSLSHAAAVIAQPSIPVVAPDHQALTTNNPITAPLDPGPVEVNGPSKITEGGPTGLAGTVSGPGDAPVDFHSVERMPEPYGGAAAWSKFLMKNITYPEMAQNAQAQGAVWLSFIVETNGKLSNIKVIKSAGYGMDEEAIRVLKLAPAWKPGIQNGQPVRVSYSIPIRFILGDNN